MDNTLILNFPASSDEEKSHVVVRLTTSYWHDGNGMYSKRSLRYLQRKCNGWNFINEDCDMIGANQVFPRITNLNECEDGIYTIATCNERSDWETPHIIDDYDYKLIPLLETPKKYEK